MIKHFDIHTNKGYFRLFNLPIIEKIEQFGGQVIYKIKGLQNEKSLPNPDNSYLTLIGHLEFLNSKLLNSKVFDLNFNDENYLKIIDHSFSKYGKTIFNQDRIDPELELEFYDNRYITKINRA